MAVTGGIAAAVGGVAGAAKSIAGGMGGGGGGGGGQNEQYDNLLRQQIAQNYGNIPLPDLSGAPNTAPYGMQTWLKDYQPEVYNPYIGQVTQMQDDPAMRDKQMQTLDQLGQWAKGGLLPTDLQTLATIQQQQAGGATSQAQSVVDQMRQRGTGGAGAEMAARLSANQQAGEGTHDLYNQALADALQRQTQAVTAQGQLATNVRGQEAQISSQMADINNAFNTQVQGLRTAAAANAANTRNQAQMFNLQGQQGVANQNVQTGNANLDLFRQVAQQGFGNQMTKMNAQAGAYDKQISDLQASDAAAAQRKLGASQDLTAGIKGLTDVAKAGQSSNWFGLGGNNNAQNSINAWTQSTQNDPNYQGVTW